MLAKSGGNAILYGTLAVGNGVGSADSARVRESANFQIGNIPITIREDGWLDVGDYSDTVGAITFNGGHAGSSGTGTLNLGGTVTVNGSSEEALLDGNVYMGSGTRTFDVAEGSVGYELRVNAVLSGGGLTKTGHGLMSLHGSNTHTGETTINQGRLYVGNNNAFGGTVGGTTVTGSGFIQLLGAVDVGNEPLALGRTAPGSVLYAGSASSWAGDVTLNEDAVLACGNSLEFSGTISGSGGITFNGPGDLILSGSANNVYTGPTLVIDGRLLMNKAFPYCAVHDGSLTVGDGSGAAGSALAQALGPFQVGSIPLTVNGDGLLDFNNSNDTVGNSLTLNEGGDVQTGAGTLMMGANSQITVDSSSASSTISGEFNVGTGTCTFNIADGTLSVPASVSGSANIIKTGGGYMYLQSSNSFSGTMTVEQFYLDISHPRALGKEAAGTYVNNAAILGVSGGAAVTGEPLTMDSSYSSGAIWIGSGANLWGGPVTLLQDTSVRVYAGYSLNVSGPVDGAGGLAKLGGGTLILSGTDPNTFAGDTVVKEGVLQLSKSGLVEAISAGSLTIGDGDGGAEADVVRETFNHQIGDLPVRINDSGLLDLNDRLDYLSALTLDGGRVTTGASYLALAGDVTVLANTVRAARISGHVWLPGLRTFDVANASSFYPDLAVYATVEGDGGIEKTGEGALLFYSANTYAGQTLVTEGVLGAYHSSALGGTTNGTVVSSGATLIVNDNSHVLAEPLTLSGTGYGAYGALDSFIGANSWAGDILLAGDAEIRVLGIEDTLTLSGSVSGASGFTKTGLGTLILSGSAANTYAGETHLDSGILELAKLGTDGAIPGQLLVGDGLGGADADVVRLGRNNQIANVADVTVSSSGLFDLNGYYDRVDAFTGSGSVALGSGHLVAGHSGSTFTFDGMASGSGYLWKVGNGTWTLTANNIYSGTTRIETGTLIINGSQPGSDVLVQANGTLGGTGVVGEIDSQGAVAPGSSPGQLYGRTTLLRSGSTFAVELDGFMAGSGYDQLNSIDPVELDTPNLTVSLGCLPAVGDQFLILANNGTNPIAGTFAGLPDGGSLTASNATLEIDYDGGTGNDVVLTVTDVIPVEPLRISSWGTSGSDVRLTWRGGVPRYMVEKKTALTNATWSPVTAPMRETQTNLPMDSPHGFYRVTGGN